MESRFHECIPYAARRNVVHSGHSSVVEPQVLNLHVFRVQRTERDATNIDIVELDRGKDLNRDGAISIQVPLARRGVRVARRPSAPRQQELAKDLLRKLKLRSRVS